MFVLADEEGSILSPRNSSYLLNAYHVGGVDFTDAVQTPCLVSVPSPTGVLVWPINDLSIPLIIYPAKLLAI